MSCRWQVHMACRGGLVLRLLEGVSLNRFFCGRAMRAKGTKITAVMLGLVVLSLVWLGYRPAEKERVGATQGGPEVESGPVLRLGLVPERDVFAQRRAYQKLAEYVRGKTGIRVELATMNSYRSVLEDFHEGKIDAAFLGSLVAVMAVDREGAVITCKPEYEGGGSTYRGVIFVRGDSAIAGIEGLAGKTVGMVRTTTGGNLYPMWELVRRGMVGNEKMPRLVWSGTHDDVIAEVASGAVEAGAAKDLRVVAYEQGHPGVRFRVLGQSEAVPENALVWGKDFSKEKREAVIGVLMGMKEDEAGRAVLSGLGMSRFVHCRVAEYGPIYRMIREIGGAWGELGIEGEPPREVEGAATMQGAADAHRGGM